MSTFMFKNETNEYTSVSNVFIDKYMPEARGEYVKVYLLGLKYCMCGEIGVNSSMLSNTLHLIETDVINAWKYWNDQGVVKFNPIDNMGNYNIEFLNLSKQNEIKDNNNTNELKLLNELNDNSIKEMLYDIEKFIARPLSIEEMTTYIKWINELNFTPEIILLLIQYCVSKGKTNHRYIEKVALSWYDAKITTVDEAQIFIKKNEDNWINYRRILKYLGFNTSEVPKPQEQMMDKWLNVYKFSMEIILKACDICFERLNKADFKYIDGILNSWFKSDIKTLEDIELKDTKKPNYNKNNKSSKQKGNFNNYNQRNYDFKNLEKKLLEWENNYD